MRLKTLAIQSVPARWAAAGAVKTEFDKFGQGLSKMQQRLRRTDEELDNLIGGASRAISRKLRAVQTMDLALLPLRAGQCWPGKPGRHVCRRMGKSSDVQNIPSVIPCDFSDDVV